MKTRACILLVLLAASLLSSSRLVQAQGGSWPTREWLTSSPEEQGLDSRVLAAAVDFGAASEMDSLTVIRNGRIVLDTTFAPFRPGLKHKMYSTTKSVVATLVAIALAEGRIESADKRLVDFFPELTIANLDERKKAITLRHLLDMTAGFEWEEPFGRAPTSVIAMEQSGNLRQYALDRPMEREPGTRFRYNSGVSHLLSAILGKATGMSALDYAREKLFTPLGIEDVIWHADSQGVSRGGYGLHLQPRDMAKLGYLWLRRGQWEGRQIVPAAFIDSVRRADVEMLERWSANLRYGSQFWVIPGQDTFLAAGLHGQHIIALPRRDMVIVTTGGTRHGTGILEGKLIVPQFDFGAVINRVVAAVKSDRALPADAGAASLLAASLKAAATETPTSPNALPETASRISGMTFRFPDNGFRLKSMRFDLAGAGMTYEYETGYAPGSKWGGAIGFDGLYKEGRRPLGPSVAKGLWLDRNTLVIESQTLGNDDATRLTLVFGDRTVDLAYEGWEFPRFTIEGRVED